MDIFTRNLIIILFVLIGFFVAIILSFSFKENHTYRKIFKCFPLFLISILEIIIFPQYPLIFVASITALIGDAFLISKDIKMFSFGTAAFFSGHVLNLTQLFLIFYKTSSISPFIFVLMPVIYILIIIGGFIMFKGKLTKKLTFMGATYFTSLMINIVFGLILAFISKNYLFALYSLAYILFAISDSILTFNGFIKPIKKGEFILLAFYYPAEILIAISFILILL